MRILSILKIKFIKSYMIFTKNTKKAKNNFEAPKKTKLDLFPGRILPCKQNNLLYTALYTIYSYVSGDGI